jgi:curved DNA-binding protein
MRGGRSGRASRKNHRAQQGRTQEAEISIPLADAFHGAARRITLSTTDETGEESTRSYEVRIPAGVTDGSTIRLPGQGGEGFGGGPAGDLLLKVTIAPDAKFRIDPEQKHNLITTLNIAPWEAALGARVHLATVDGEITVTIPPGSQSGQKMRFKGKGLPMRSKTDGSLSATHGDLYAELRIVTPKVLTDEQKALWEELAKASNFDPRAT